MSKLTVYFIFLFLFYRFSLNNPTSGAFCDEVGSGSEMETDPNLESEVLSILEEVNEKVLSLPLRLGKVVKRLHDSLGNVSCQKRNSSIRYQDRIRSLIDTIAQKDEKISQITSLHNNTIRLCTTLENEKSEETEAKDSLRRELEASKQRIFDLEKEVSFSLESKQKAVEKSKKFKKLYSDSKALASALHVSFTNQVHEINNLKTKLGKRVEGGSTPPPNVDEDSEDSE